MKLQSFFYPLAIASVIFSSSCDRTEASYITPKCTSAPNQSIKVTEAREYESYWRFYELKEWEWVILKYSDKTFVDLCTSDKNGVDVKVVGNFIEVRAYMKITDRDSVEVPIVKKNAANNMFSFEGALDNIDLQPYYQHYPGKFKPVLYIKMPFDDDDKNNRTYMIERLNINLDNVKIEPTGSKTI